MNRVLGSALRGSWSLGIRRPCLEVVTERVVKDGQDL